MFGVGEPTRVDRVVIAEDHAVVRMGLRALIASEPGLSLAGDNTFSGGVTVGNGNHVDVYYVNALGTGPLNIMRGALNSQ